MVPCVTSFGFCASPRDDRGARSLIAMETVEPIQCPLCSSKDLQVAILPYPLFRHVDFTVFHPGPNKIGNCRVCRLVFRIISDADQKNIDAIYTSESYLRHEEPHTLVIDGNDEPVPLPAVQAGILQPFLDGTDISLLDIGCFDGRLLVEIEQVCHASYLCGFDVGDRPQFPRRQNFRFISGEMDVIRGTFDWILMSHSIQYIRNIRQLFARISELLKPAGRLFIQVPDFSLKPASLLLGDLYYHYTPAILGNILRRMGFINMQILETDYFPRDILAIASFVKSKDESTDLPDGHLNDCLSRLADMSGQLSRLESEDRTGVLGTTIDAAFADYCLGNRVAFFVDENPKKVGTTFHGKPVLHPESIQNGDLVVIPMGIAGDSIRSRFANRYSGSYVCI